MNKKLIAMVIAGIFAVPMAAQAEGVAISGFADIIYDADASAFGADAEVDLIGTVGSVTGRLDLDADLVTNGGNGSTGIEQALFAWGVNDTVTLIGGVFNNPIGQDAEDAPDMNFTTHTAVYNILDHQTVLDGNNIAGIAGAFNLGIATITVAFLNDIQHVVDENSVAAVVNLTPVEGLALELGYVTQASGAEDVMNLNATYNFANSFTIGVDYLTADQIVDSAYNVWAGFGTGDFGVKLFTETVAWQAGGADTTNSGVYGSYQLNDNLAAAIQYSTGDDAASPLATIVTGIGTEDLTTLEFIVSF